MNGRKSVLVRPADVSPSTDEVEVVGIFNPGAVDVDGVVHLLLRVAERPREERPGWVALPTFGSGGRYEVDWVREQDVDRLDPRGVAIRRNGQHRLTTVSRLRLATSSDGRCIDWISLSPTLAPTARYESWGMEDARIVRIGDAYYITYVAVSRDGIVTALARTNNFETFERLGVIFPVENKNVVLFPRRIGDRYAALHRPASRTPIGEPGVWRARSPDLLYWGRHERLAIPSPHDRVIRTGAGPPPVETEQGWLLVYHTVLSRGRGAGVYEAWVLLLDREDPSRIIRVRNSPLFAGDARATAGDALGGVVFPSGLVRRENAYMIYAGLRDEQTTVHIVPEDEII
jgi:beta-1,2-mannobiose phosphorylase / 1,2-beta-oligomannan phosphorylase